MSSMPHWLAMSSSRFRTLSGTYPGTTRLQMNWRKLKLSFRLCTNSSSATIVELSASFVIAFVSALKMKNSTGGRCTPSRTSAFSKKRWSWR